MEPVQHSWRDVYWEEQSKPYMLELRNFLERERNANKTVLPLLSSNTLRALDLTSMWQVKCVIIGQDPYPQPENATGLAFAVPYTTKAANHPGSLKNIARALKVDLNVKLNSPDLVPWASQGVLLLNRILTVEKGKPLSHANKGWERFTEMVCRAIIDSGRPVIWLLWGSVAQETILPLLEASYAFEKGHEVITACHPSPAAAKGGFVWHKPFSKVDAFCEKMGYSQIRWDE